MNLTRMSFPAAAFVLLLAGCGEHQERETPLHPDFTTFVVRRGDRLMEGDREFRFFGLAAPNVQQNESQLRRDMVNRFPDEFEIRDLFSGIQRTGGLATRTFTLSVSAPADSGVPVYIPARRTYNEEAFRCLDRVVALAHEYNIRLIIPLIASQSFRTIRGVDEFAALAGKPPGSFWTDEEVKADFRHLLSYIVARRNSVNGRLYRDEPAILAWQLGNEFGSYAGDRNLPYDVWSPRILSWCIEMAAYLRSIDQNHLVMEAGGADRKALLEDPHIDIISDHLYEYWNRLGGKPWILGPIAHDSREECRGKKPLVVDEFGLGSTENLTALMDTIRASGISGGLLWSIRSHRRDGGWYYHNEGGTRVNSFHVPGFSDGFQYDETRMLDILRVKAFAIRGIRSAEPAKPAPVPELIARGGGFTWRGSAGARYYTIERAESPGGTWRVLATGLEDSVIGDVALFEPGPEASEPLVLYYDQTREKGTAYRYRIKAVNEAGETDYSPVVEIPSAGPGAQR